MYREVENGRKEGKCRLEELFPLRGNDIGEGEEGPLESDDTRPMTGERVRRSVLIVLGGTRLWSPLRSQE